MTIRKLKFVKNDEIFSTVASFQYSSEAQIVKGRLEAEGIRVFLSDNLTIDTDPLVSNAIGGVKLKVRFEDEDDAISILKSINRYSIDDQGNAVVCPNCNSKKVDYFTNVKDFKSLISFLVGFIFGVLPFYTKYEYRCENCKNKFNI
ncbi:DUF2007 domain-containing protein [Kriegella aquimaris]|uniref:Putative signal transducing protein n=1 Tax=Kriegella aquimaris TaxID=192904 RepID=A0A1G9M0F9_9FLAO|nr:DUF2007 domain-containing protein [Kriegella aquimaris]SDL67686.1 Putative signal transducing protein [Kriegella aquimaris]